MSSPFVPCSFTYGDLPQGGTLAPMVVSPRVPSNTVDKQYAAGYYWLSSLNMYTVGPGGVLTYGNGNMYYQAGNSSGAPNWTLVSSGSFASTATALDKTAGKVTLVGGTATVTTTAVKAGSQIRLYRQTIGATGAAALGILTLGTVTAGTSFVINAVTPASATALQATDVSIIGWEVIS